MRLLLRRLLWAALACFVLLGVAAGVVWYWVRVDHSYDEPEIEAALGWKLPKDTGYGELQQTVTRNPLPFLQLLAHDSKHVRRWAERVLTYAHGTDSLNDHILDLISAELNEKNYHDYGYDQRALVRILASAGGRGAKRLALLYRSKRSIEPIVHAEICSQGAGDELLNALLEVAKDDAVFLENRCRAVEVFGHIRKPDPISGTAKAEEAATAKLTSLLPQLPEPVANTARVALQRVERDNQDDRKEGERRSPANPQVILPEKDGGTDALAALKDKKDWLRVGYAAEVLARHGMKEAIPELQRVAATHWYAPVRKTAQQAVQVLQGQESALAVYGKHPPSPYASLVMQYEKDAFAAWWKEFSSESFQEKYEYWLWSVSRNVATARNAVFWRLQPKVDLVLFEEPGRLPMVENLEEFGRRPKEAIRFAGGKLLGYDDGEFGAGTVFYRKGEMARYFRTDNVKLFIRAPCGVLVLCDVAMMGDRVTYLASERPDGRVSVDFFMRMPAGFGRPNVLPSGEAFIPCALGDIPISPTGEIRTVPHPGR